MKHKCYNTISAIKKILICFYICKYIEMCKKYEIIINYKAYKFSVRGFYNMEVVVLYILHDDHDHSVKSDMIGKKKKKWHFHK